MFIYRHIQYYDHDLDLVRYISCKPEDMYFPTCINYLVILSTLAEYIIISSPNSGTEIVTEDTERSPSHAL